MEENSKSLEGEYNLRGEYHKNLDKKWRYYPIYIEKMSFVKKYLNKIPKSSKIVDIGCGEGILVEEYRNKSYDIVGVDNFYSSEYVKKGDITNLNFKNNSFDLVLCLDVLEHLSYKEQERAIAEIYSILKINGMAIISVPNLAHIASRITFLLLGKLLRTSSIERHIGDRPIGEYINLFRKYRFSTIKRKGLFPTYPIISILTYFFPDKVLRMHKIYNKILSYPNFCFLNIFVLKK